MSEQYKVRCNTSYMNVLVAALKKINLGGAVAEWVRAVAEWVRALACTGDRTQIFYSHYDSRYVGCHWLQFAPFLCTNLIGQGPELLTTPAAIKICGHC